jgi:hypothetical protein
MIGPRMQSQQMVSLVDHPLVMGELISHGLLIKDEDNLRFRHDTARVAIEAAVPPYRKAANNTKIMDALLSQPCHDGARLMFHAEGRRQGRLVVRYGRVPAREPREQANASS